MSKRRQRADQAARTERLSDEVAALHDDIFQLEQHLGEVARLSSSPQPRRGLGQDYVTDVGSDRYPANLSGATFVGRAVPRVDAVEYCVQDKSGAAEAQLRHFVVQFQHGWTRTMDSDLGRFFREDVAVVYAQPATRSELSKDTLEGGLRGLVAKWKCSCDALHMFQMELRQLVSLEPPLEWLLSVDVTCQMTFEAVMLHFPHVTQDCVHANAILAKLVAAPLRFDVQCHVWLDDDFKIVQAEVGVGWAAALLACLGNPDDVVWVLQPPDVQGEIPLES
ncbi:hypothetical protein H310_13594 [Aphanomyces invadans]|uniref:Uncharacterized protein n=1 Tax=Aphanomyces invadans TaxID=157072 RepID=A0A024TCT5_9STRA|nr:hypothetical protein H310_13594 [Aphanomyces invadans]ETV91945.1 hypothetical protein H310_13594 [Aphanomyces invadans]|eukprot:XP_008879369.1 hypothetical protein H310_13594 [Aphanomyces invadans]